MGIHLNLASMLADLAVRHHMSGHVCTLGEQTLGFTMAELHVLAARLGLTMPTGELDAAALFRAYGFADAESIDFRADEGATHIFDLNEPALPAALAGRFDAVLNGGTLEHVFHLPNALANITRLLAPGGVVIHVLPCHNWVDHGFYQFGPSMMFDYYAAAGFDILESALIAYRRDAPDSWQVRAAAPGIAGAGLSGTFDERIYLQFFAARRPANAVEFPIPIQGLYAGAAAQDWRQSLRWFAPYVLRGGEALDLPSKAHVTLTGRLVPHQGHAWRAPLPELAGVADDPVNPARSGLLVFEDGRPLGPAHAAHALIAAKGGGAYSHWGDAVYLSSPDGVPPGESGRDYTAVLYDEAEVT